MTDGVYNGLTIGGAGADVSLVRRTGLRGLPRRRGSEQANPRGGVVFGPDDRDARTITLVLGLRAATPSAFSTLRQQVLDAFTTGLTLPYTYDNGTRTVFAQVEDLDVPEDWVFGAPQRLEEATVVLRCGDPNIYGAADSDTLTQASPLIVPNVGTVEAPFIAEIPGPVTDPRLRRDDNDTFYVYRWLGLTVPADDVLTLDLYAETAILDGVDVWPPTNDAGDPSPIWGIPAGGEQVNFGRDAGEPGNPTVTITHRPAWKAA